MLCRGRWVLLTPLSGILLVDALKGRSLPRGGQHVCMAGKSMLPRYYFFSFKKWGLQPQGGNQCQQISVLSKSRPWERGFSVP